MAISQYYVDPSIAGDSGAGTSGDPYGDLQYALNQITRNSTDGDQINIKNGTDEVLAASLTLATYGTPTTAAPLIFRGYTSAANDGGKGGIDGDGSYRMFASGGYDAIVLWDLHMHNTGTADVVDLDNNISIINCEVDNTTGDGINIDNNCEVIGCYVHNVGGSAIDCNQFEITGNYIENGTNDCTTAIRTVNAVVRDNVINIDGASDGIYANGFAKITFNSIYSSSGTGEGINYVGEGGSITHNIVEGFSGAGGDGYLIAASTLLYLYRGNRWYNCTTGETVSGIVIEDSDNSVLTASPFTAPGSDDFSVGTEVKAGANRTYYGVGTTSYLDIGAVQRQEPAGGGGSGRRSRIRLHGA